MRNITRAHRFVAIYSKQITMTYVAANRVEYTVRRGLLNQLYVSSLTHRYHK